MGNLITVAEAAALIDAKPWEVMRLINSGAIASAVLVDADSLREHQEQNA